MLVALLSIPTLGYAQTNDCLSNYNDELNLHDKLNSEISQNITSMGLNPHDADQYRKSLSNDPLGEQFDQTTKCLESKWDPPSNNDTSSSTSTTIITAILTSVGGAALVIIGTEKWNHKVIVKNSKIAIKSELINARNTLDDKVDASSGGMTYEYSPNIISTTAFDSIVSSGAFLRFPSNLQEYLVMTYFYIRQQNVLLEKLDSLVTTAHIQTVLPTTADILIRYYDDIVYDQGLLSGNYLARIDDWL